MSSPSPIPGAWVKLGGKRIDPISVESLPGILQKLHPDLASNAIFHRSDATRLMITYTTSGNFRIYFKEPGAKRGFYRPKMSTGDEALKLVAAFLRTDPDWKSGIEWKEEKRWITWAANALIIALAIFALYSCSHDMKDFWHALPGLLKK